MFPRQRDDRVEHPSAATATTCPGRPPHGGSARGVGVPVSCHVVGRVDPRHRGGGHRRRTGRLVRRHCVVQAPARPPDSAHGAHPGELGADGGARRHHGRRPRADDGVCHPRDRASRRRSAHRARRARDRAAHHRVHGRRGRAVGGGPSSASGGRRSRDMAQAARRDDTGGPDPRGGDRGRRAPRMGSARDRGPGRHRRGCARAPARSPSSRRAGARRAAGLP